MDSQESDSGICSEPLESSREFRRRTSKEKQIKWKTHLCYHVSPEYFDKASPRSIFFHQKGIFLCPSFTDVSSWSNYVAGKKHEYRNIAHKARRLEKLDGQLEDGLFPLQQQTEYLKLDANREQLYSYRYPKNFRQDSILNSLYVHTFLLPDWLYHKALEFYRTGEEYHYQQGWNQLEEEIFVPAQLMPHLVHLKAHRVDYVKSFHALSARRRPNGRDHNKFRLTENTRFDQYQTYSEYLSESEEYVDPVLAS